MRWWAWPLTGILLYAAWPGSPLTMLLLAAWVPLLLQERQCSTARFFLLAWLNMLLWNLATTWWIWNASPPGAVGAIVANSLLMCFPLMAFRLTRRHAGEVPGYSSLPLYWISFEYLHHQWDLSWPWLTLGNGLANSTSFVQWYAYTGTTGGTLWLWVVNVLVLGSLLQWPWLKRRTGLALRLLLIMGPLVASGFILRWQPPDTANAATNVVVVQPNVEPYTEKFNTPPDTLVARLISQSEAAIDSNTRLLVWPETAIPAQAWEHRLAENTVFQPVYALLARHPQLLLVTGIDSYRYWGSTNPGGLSSRQMSDGSYYEAFNTAMGAAAGQPPALYHKSKLVPGVEGLPSWLGFMGSLFDDFGGISGSLGKSDSAMVFRQPGNAYQPAPIICYESIYSDYVTDYVRRGANVLTVITNDGWWGHTPGYRQHMSMSRLRAIENRQWVLRSANTGISCIISPTGQVVQQLDWNERGVLKAAIPPATGTSFYSRHGDWISRLCWPLALLLLLWALYKRLLARRAQTIVP